MNDDPFEVLDGNQRICLIQNDVLVALSWLPDGCVDFVFPDVPYGLGSHEPTSEELIAYLLGNSGLRTGGDFMGSDWEIPSVAIWKEIYRICKPGAFLFCWASPKTSDLISMGIRMAGFEKRDEFKWIYSQGTAKGVLNVGKAVDKKLGSERPVIGSRTLTGTAALSIAEKGGTYGTGVSGVGARKEVPITAPGSPEAAEWEGHASGVAPCYEPILVFRKPLEGTLVENVLKYGLGAYNIEGCRVPTDWDEPDRPESWKRSGHSAKPDAEKIAAPPGVGINLNPAGRWATNLFFSHAQGCTPEVCDPSCPLAELDRQAGIRKSGARKAGVRKGMGYHGGSGDGGPEIKASEGSAARFYPCFPYQEDPVITRWMYCPKASRIEREVGCEHLPPASRTDVTRRKEGSAGQDTQFAGMRRKGDIHNIGKCIKPINVDRWLARLGGKPDGIALVPFFGTASEVIGCLLEGMSVIGIERDPAMFPIAEGRIEWWQSHPGGLTEAARKQHKIEKSGQIELFKGSK